MNALELLKLQMREEAGIIMPTITRQGNNAVYSKECKIIKTIYEVKITLPEYVEILANKNISDVLSHRTADEREFIISGITPAEWKDMFKESNKMTDKEFEDALNKWKF